MNEVASSTDAPCPLKVKTCRRCGHTGEESEFRENRRTCLPCHKVRAGGSSRRWNEKNKARVAAYDAARYHQNKDRCSAQSKGYHAAHRDRLNAKRAERRIINLDREVSRQKAYQKTKKGRMVSANARHGRRAKMKGGGVSAAWLAEQMRLAKHCPYCSLPYGKGRKKSIDHVIPFKRSGAHSRENILICCLPCNNKKRCKTPEQWACEIGRLFI